MSLPLNPLYNIEPGDAMVKKWYMVRDGHPVVEFVASPDSLRGSCEVAVFLTMLETSGNQRYVFSSPRQKENIGGSYLLTMLAPWTAELAEAHGIGTTPVSESSGKVILLVDTQEDARTLISAVTRRVAALAPGMDVTGVFMELPGGQRSQHGRAVTQDDLRRIHSLAGRYNLSRPPAEARFSQRPYLQRADDSVLPAAPPTTLLRTRPPAGKTYSLPSQVKRACAALARDRLVSEARKDQALQDLVEDAPVLLMDSLKALEDAFDSAPEPDSDPEAAAAKETPNPEPAEASPEPDAEPAGAGRVPIDLARIAVVHIDGNGVGAIMRDLQSSKDCIPAQVFTEQVGCPPDHPEALRRFLIQINTRFDEAVKKSFFHAWAKVARWWRADNSGRPIADIIPVVPILLGGDDLTVLTEGRYALPFMETYLKAYEQRTREDPLLGYLGPRSTTEQPGPMTAAAGAAIVPRPFPFHLAYTLSERLVSAAKGIGKTQGKECSTLTFHALFDSTITDAAELLAGYASFTARPYRLTGVGAQETGSLQGSVWGKMLGRTVAFRGMMADDVPAFPKTRAARIRSLLSRRAAAGPGTKEREDLEETIRVEWADAGRVLGDRLLDEIGDPQYLFDLIELSELLPASYLEEKDS